MAEPLNTGLSAQQVLTAFNRALNDYTDTEIDTLLSAKQDALTFDSAPTEDSTNPVTSGGVKTALDGKQDTISDLAAIRSGAAAGSAAVQPSDLQTTVQGLQTEIETKVTMQQVYGDATEIPANSDLNNYTTPGIYYALVANVPTIANTPYTATGFRLAVEKNTPSGAAIFQTIYPTSRSHLEFFRRIYEGGAWSSWYKFEGTVVS